MLFNSWIFAGFFLLFMPVFLFVRNNLRLRNLWLLLASYVFYGWWNPRFVTLLAILAAVDYLAARGVAGLSVSRRDKAKAAVFTVGTTVVCALFIGADALWLIQITTAFVALLLVATFAIGRASADRQRRFWLYLSIGANLGILAYFKYANFFLASVQDALRAVGWEVDTFTLSIILPIGLSFHVFQGVSRTVDCYRGVVKPEGSLTTVATYLAFFPQLVAGPIERAAHLIPQFQTVRPISWQLFSSGALLFVWGMYQKVVVADNVAPIANDVFANASTATGATAVAGVLAFTLQIYCDFCGYSNMARGLARCLGFDLMANFDLPYFARTPSEFWKRWHISLSTWLRDYLYVTLGGNRHGSRTMYRNLMLTMLLGGLWHGAAWTFVVWGAFHGAIQVVYRVLKVDALISRVKFASAKGLAIHGFAWMSTMVLVMIGWVFFRATSFQNAADIFSAVLRFDGYSWSVFRPLVAFAGPLILVEVFQRASGRAEVLSVGPFILRYTATVLVLMTIALISAPPGQEFIYFDF